MTQAAKLAQLGSPGISTGFKNRIINGAMMIDQYHAGASFTPTDNTIAFDRWKYNAYQANKFTCQQTPSATETGYATRVAAGFTNYMAWTVASAYTPTTNEYFIFDQRIEGLNVADLGWGTASAKTVTLSFWVYSSLTGTHSGAITNSGFDRSYPFSFSVSSANTWTSVSVTISGDTSGTWLTTNGTGMVVLFNLGSNASRLTTAGSWAAGNYTGVTGSVQVITNAGATFYITGVQLEVGTTATDFEYRDYGRELIMCQRYYWRNNYANYFSIASGTVWQTNVGRLTLQHPVIMRAAPSISYSGDVRVGTQGANAQVTGIPSQWGSPQSTLFEVSFSSSWSTGLGLVMWSNSSSTDSFQASAEL